MAPVSLGERLTGVKAGLPCSSQRSNGVTPAGGLSPQITTSERPALLRMSISAAALSAEATTARAPQSPMMNFTSSGVSMTLTGLTTAPVLAMA